MTMTSGYIKEQVELLQQVNQGNRAFTLANPSSLRFTYPTREEIDFGSGLKPLICGEEGILLYDHEARQYMGYFPGHLEIGKETQIRPCTNGEEYDTTGEEHPVDDPVQEEYGTCTVAGPVEEH
ncbi:hypothetical protein [Bifidobacterium asteroides]|uniref:Uncharacterized protein n=1 Tax=Bifidobacterium asteroides TaxID=1684 RepID=A0A318MWA9_9BIFI|nr:hypothetical protein [Bifidobacterium asteroides]PXY88295.1 hypothetical protein DKK74_03745 [Bifidobacterium asteroides]